MFYSFEFRPTMIQYRLLPSLIRILAARHPTHAAHYVLHAFYRYLNIYFFLAGHVANHPNPKKVVGPSDCKVPIRLKCVLCGFSQANSLVHPSWWSLLLENSGDFPGILRQKTCGLWVPSQITKFTWPIWGPPGSYRPQVVPHVGPMSLAIRDALRFTGKPYCNHHRLCQERAQGWWHLNRPHCKHGILVGEPALPCWWTTDGLMIF